MSQFPLKFQWEDFFGPGWTFRWRNKGRGRERNRQTHIPNSQVITALLWDVGDPHSCPCSKSGSVGAQIWVSHIANHWAVTSGGSLSLVNNFSQKNSKGLIFTQMQNKNKYPNLKIIHKMEFFLASPTSSLPSLLPSRCTLPGLVAKEKLSALFSSVAFSLNSSFPTGLALSYNLQPCDPRIYSLHLGGTEGSWALTPLKGQHILCLLPSNCIPKFKRIMV